MQMYRVVPITKKRELKTAQSATGQYMLIYTDLHENVLQILHVLGFLFPDDISL